ncbi:hypothetical protein [Streptomyces sp. NPDC017890]|uniref:hypothetical protein n=1 Tax=Streptomyces sp. NPDC017890 TaxID=3365015 RepID=UPI0037B5E52D
MAICINTAREVVQACCFSGGTHAPEGITLPEDLRTVPASGGCGHGGRLDKRDRFLTRNP